jgi:hypothetical protein
MRNGHFVEKSGMAKPPRLRPVRKKSGRRTLACEIGVFLCELSYRRLPQPPAELCGNNSCRAAKAQRNQLFGALNRLGDLISATVLALNAAGFRPFAGKQHPVTRHKVISRGRCQRNISLYTHLLYLMN